MIYSSNFIAKTKKFIHYSFVFIHVKFTIVYNLPKVYCDAFISWLDFHSDGTHLLQRIHWWTNDEMLNFSKSGCKSLWIKVAAKWINKNTYYSYITKKYIFAIMV